MINPFRRYIIYALDRNIHPKRIAELTQLLNYVYILIGGILFSLSTGILGFMLIEKYDFVDAFYMTIITISTVGFGELHELSQGGRIFVALFIISNIGIYAYAVSNLATIFVEGKLRRILRNLFIGRKIDRMKNHIIVCGYGRYGKIVTNHLIDQNIPSVLIEINPEKVEKIRQERSLTVIDGDATDTDTLKEAGIDHAKAIITSLPDDADNVYTILSARTLNPNIKIVSRARDASSELNLKRAGADDVIVPENVGGFFMSALVTKPDIIHLLGNLSSATDHSFRMVEFQVDLLPEQFKGKTIGWLNLEEQTGIKIIGVKMGDASIIFNPSSETALDNDIALFVLGTHEQIAEVVPLLSGFNLIQ